MITFKEYQAKQLLTESFRRHKNNQPLDLTTDNEQFMPANMVEYDILDTNPAHMMIVKPSHGLFKGQTEDFYGFFAMPTRYLRDKQVLFVFDTDDPLYANYVFIPTINDAVRIIINCSDPSLGSIDTQLLKKLRSNFVSKYDNNIYSHERFMSENDIVISVGSSNQPSTDPYKNYQLIKKNDNRSNELRGMFSGRFKTGIPTDNNSVISHGINQFDHADRYRILCNLVSQNQGNFGRVLFDMWKPHQSHYSTDFVGRVLEDGIILYIQKDSGEIRDIMFYSPFELPLMFLAKQNEPGMITNFNEIPISVLRTAYYNIETKRSMTDHTNDSFKQFQL